MSTDSLYYAGPLRLAVADGYVVSDVRPGDYVRVSRSSFGDDVGGYASALVRVGTDPLDVALSVRLDLPDDSGAIRDAVADGLADALGGTDAVEIFDVVPLSAVVVVPLGGPERAARVGVRPLSDAERAARARSRGAARLSLPDLDAGLRSRSARR